MVSTMRSQSHQFKFYDIFYVNNIIEVLSFVKYWDVLYDVYEMNQELVRPSICITLPHVDGLKA